MMLLPKKNKKNMNILIACEESQAVCKTFRKLGYNAYSCDILPSSGGHPEWHYNSDVFGVIKNKGGFLENGDKNYIDGNWDLMIAHPPCTYLSVSGARWFKDKQTEQQNALDFISRLLLCPIPKIALENPIGIISTLIIRMINIYQLLKEDHTLGFQIEEKNKKMQLIFL